MQIRILIKSGTAERREGEFDGRKYSYRRQPAWLVTQGKPFPVEFFMRLDDDQAPYPEGEYTLAEGSVYVDRKGRLSVFPRLEAVAKSAPRSAQA